MENFIAGYEAQVALGFILLLFAAFVWEIYPPEVTASAGAALFIVLGFTPFDDAMAVFSNPAPITIAAMFVISGALVRTGLLDAVANLVIRHAQHRPILSVLAILLATMIGSAFVNNTPVVLVLIPVVVRLAASLEIAPTRLLIPLSYVAVLGGTLTLVGSSTNLLVDGVAREQGLAPFTIFEVAPVGIVVALGGSIALMILGRFLLPDRKNTANPDLSRSVTYMTEVRVTDDFAGIDETVADIADLNRAGIEVTGIRHAGQTIRGADLPGHMVQRGDTLILRATTTELLTLRDIEGLRVGIRRGVVGDEDEDLIIADAMVTPNPGATGELIAQLSIGHRFGMRVLGAHRHGHSVGPDLVSARLRPADRLLLEGPASGFEAMSQAGDLVAINRPAARAYRRRRAPMALIALAAVVILAAFNIAPIGILALIAVASILVLRCIDGDEAWASIDASILVLIFSMLMIGKGLQNTGAVDLIITGITPYIVDLPPLVMLAAIYLLTSVLTEMVTNNAVAVIVTPIAIGLAGSMGIDPRPVVVAVMFGASASFATPIGYQTNTLVYGAGNYRFADFLRIGVPMNLIAGAIAVVMIPVFFPF